MIYGQEPTPRTACPPGSRFDTGTVTLRAWASWPLGGETPARGARDMVTSALRHELSCDDDTVDRAGAATFELAANAFTHGTGPVWLSMWLAWDSIAVHVSDTAGNTPVAMPDYRPDAEADYRQITPAEFDAMGPHFDAMTADQAEAALARLEHRRGLALVVQHSRGRCGVAYDPEHGGKSVWFAVTAPWRPDGRRAPRPRHDVRALPGRVVPLDPQRPVPHVGPRPRAHTG